MARYAYPAGQERPFESTIRPMATVAIEVPEQILAITGKTPEEFAGDARLLLAAKLFELGRLSSGQAAKLCGMGRVDFLLGLGSLGVSAIQVDADDLRAELARA
jgi:predicted HTH domain antitoxin